MLQIHAAAGDASTLRWSALELDQRRLSFAEVFALWRSAAEFRSAWVQALRGVAFTAYGWECPPLTNGTLQRGFECVFVDSPQLARSRANAAPFDEHFTPDTAAVGFASLGKDSWLIAPCPEPTADCAHLASFTRTASEAHATEFWRTVGEALGSRLQAAPMWLSTAGLGVAWLHVRMDTRPKYYRHAPYKQPPR